METASFVQQFITKFNEEVQNKLASTSNTASKESSLLVRKKKDSIGGELVGGGGSRLTLALVPETGASVYVHTRNNKRYQSLPPPMS